MYWNFSIPEDLGQGAFQHEALLTALHSEPETRKRENQKVLKEILMVQCDMHPRSLFFFPSTSDWTQDLVHVTQMIYHWITSPAPNIRLNQSMCQLRLDARSRVAVSTFRDCLWLQRAIFLIPMWSCSRTHQNGQIKSCPTRRNAAEHPERLVEACCTHLLPPPSSASFPTFPQLLLSVHSKLTSCTPVSISESVSQRILSTQVLGTRLEKFCTAC